MPGAVALTAEKQMFVTILLRMNCEIGNTIQLKWKFRVNATQTRCSY